MKRLHIDFVSDVVCPWCAIGLHGLLEALRRLEGQVEAEIRFQPFELNPAMAAEGETVSEHLGRKYGVTAEQSAQNRAMIRDRAAGVGFVMDMNADSRIWNTFDAHRLLHWAGETGPQAQLALKQALLKTHFTDNAALNDPDVLVAAAVEAGLDRVATREVLSSDAHAEAVRAEQSVWRQRGISSVPAVVIEGRYLVSGGQPPEVFEQALKEIAEKTAA